MLLPLYSIEENIVDWKKCHGNACVPCTVEKISHHNQYTWGKKYTIYITAFLQKITRQASSWEIGEYNVKPSLFLSLAFLLVKNTNFFNSFAWLKHVFLLANTVTNKDNALNINLRKSYILITFQHVYF